MAEDEQFSLCWNNFNSNLSAGFHESLCRGDLVDVTLAAEGQFVKAHRLVLSVCSPYFRKMFTQMPANQHAFVFLKDVSHTALKDLIQFMYCGEVNVKQEALPAFISTAEALQIKGLTDSDPPPSQSPAEPSTPTPQQIHQIASPRVRQRTSTTRSYKIETVDDSGDDNKQATQIVIQTTAPPPPQQTTIAQQVQHLQQTQAQAHVTQQLASTGATTTTVVTHKRPARSIGSGPHIKRTKSTIDPLDTTDAATGTQQITVQTAVVTAGDSKAQVQQAQEPEYIDLPIELPTKSEPDYTEDTGEVETGEDEATYVEDDSYGDIRYDNSYFTENEDAAGNATATTQATTGTTAGGGASSATTSKTLIKQQPSSFSDTSYVETGDQTNNDAQAKILNKYAANRPLRSQLHASKTPNRSHNQTPSKVTNTHKSPTKPNQPSGDKLHQESDKNLALKIPLVASSYAQVISGETVLKVSSSGHHLTVIKKPRLRGVCVYCLKSANKSSGGNKTNTKGGDKLKVTTYCPECPGSMWMCGPCFDEVHTD